MAQLPKGGLARANNKPVHGSCAIYLPAGVVDVWTFKTRDGSRDPDIKSTLLARPKDGLPWGNVCAVASPGTPRHLFSDVVWVKLGWWFQSDIFRFFSPRTLGEDAAILTCAYFSKGLQLVNKNSPPGSFNSEFTLKIGQDTKRKGLSSNRQPSSFRGFGW